MKVYKDDKNDEVMKIIQVFANHKMTSFQNLNPCKNWLPDMQISDFP